MNIRIPKSLPLLVVVGGLYLNRDRFAGVIESGRDLGKEQVTRQELGQIAHMIRTNSLVDGLPAPGELPRMLRDDATSIIRDRDMADDLWGTLYRLEPDPSGDGTFKVRSAGPDKEYDTEDDIVIEGQSMGTR